MTLVGRDEEAIKAESRYLERQNRPQERGPVVGKSLNLLVSNVEGLYSYDEQALSRQGILDVLQALNDGNVNQLVEEYRESRKEYVRNNSNSGALFLLGVLSTPTGILITVAAEEGVIDASPALGKLITLGGLVAAGGSIRSILIAKRYFKKSGEKIQEAIVAYNRVVAAQ